MPTIWIYFKHQFYAYDGSLEQPAELIQFINKILHPALQLDSWEELDEFLDISKPVNETT